MRVDFKETFEDGFNLLCGERIASGMTRHVYDCNVDKSLVVKVESAEVRTHFQNLMEWFVWRAVCGTAYEKWFAPVVEISPNGRLLLMKRTKPASTLPDKMPAFLADFKPSNFGLYQGRLVCHDYGSNLLMQEGLSKRMRKVDWGDES